MAANYIKKEDVSTDNIYEYEYADGAFSGYWLKFKYVSVPMDTQDPFNPVQDGDAEAVYDAYIFDNEPKPVTILIGSLNNNNVIDFFYVEESVYQTIAANDPKFLDEYSLIPYQITDNIITVNKYYLPADFDINDYEQDPDEPVEVVYVTPYHSDRGNLQNLKLGDKFEGIIAAVEYTGYFETADDSTIIPGDKYNFGIFRSMDPQTPDAQAGLCYMTIVPTTSILYVYLNNEYCGKFDLSDLHLNTENTLGFMLTINRDEISQGKISFVPKFYLGNLTVDDPDPVLLENLISEDSTEEDPLSDRITFDVSQGTDEMMAFVQQFQANTYLFDFWKDSTEWHNANTLGTWHISKVVVHYCESLDNLTDNRLVLIAQDGNSFISEDSTETYPLTDMGTLYSGGK